MRTNVWSLLFASFGMFAVAAFEEPPDQLESGEYESPDSLPDYHRIIREVLREGYGEHVTLRMLVVPSFEHEWLVAVRHQGDAFEILALRPDVRLWNYPMLEMMKRGNVSKHDMSGKRLDQTDDIRRLEASMPRDFRDVRVSRCVTPIDSALAHALSNAWRVTLQQPRPPSPANLVERLIMDGTSFHFSLREPALSGRVVSPQSEWLSGQLANLGTRMRDHCTSPSTNSSDELKKLLRRFER